MGEGGEQPTQNDSWDYKSHFREYLLLLGNKGPGALETLSNYPSSIELSEAWHQTHAQMRSTTLRDRKEHLAIVGYKEDRHLALPVYPVVGTESHVPYSVLEREMQRAKDRHGVEDIVGYIHTHPDNSPLSPQDFFTLLYEPFEPELARHLPQGEPPVINYFAGLVTTEEVVYAFKTRETHMVHAFDMWPKNPSDVFAKYWYEKAGYEYHNDGGNKWIKQQRPDANKWEANLGIAKAHNLALYRGKLREDLLRSYP